MKINQEFPGGLVVRTPCFPWGLGLISGWGIKILQTLQPTKMLLKKNMHQYKIEILKKHFFLF